MNAPALPAFLANRKSAGIGSKAVEGLGAPLPPHISIRGNRFTLIDGTGNEQPVMTLNLDVNIIDVSDVTCKMYFGDNDGPIKWEAGANDPPACWSANGIAPSVEAMLPQSATCAACRWNERGSATGMDDAPIKACRDEKWMAVTIVGYGLPFQLRLTPGSFKNFRSYNEKFKGQAAVDISDIVTRITFEQGKNGVLVFDAVSYIDEPMMNAREQFLASKNTDILVGRNDRPRQAALMAPGGATGGILTGGTGQAPLLGSPGQPVGVMQTQPQQVQQPAPFVPGTAPGATSPSTGSAMPGFNPGPAQNAPPQFPSDQQQAQPPAKRGRRPKATTQPAPNGGTPAPAFAGPTAAPQAPFMQPAPQQPAFAPAAPAAPQQPAFAPGAPPTGAPANFGIAPGVAPNPEVAGLLNTIFGSNGGQQ